MKVQKFTAKSYSEALQLVKGSLGPDAVILSNQMVTTDPNDRAGQPAVQLTATSGEGAASLLESMPRRRPRPLRVERRSDDRRPEEQRLEERRPDERRTHMLEEALKPHRRRLLEQEVGERLVTQVLAAVSVRSQEAGSTGMTSVLDHLLRELIQRTPVLPDDRRRNHNRFTCLVGTSGVGKSTLLTKLAVMAALRDEHRVAMVALGRRGCGRDAMRLAAGVLECPIREAETPQALVECLLELAAYDHILLDAPGLSPFDESGRGKLAAMLAAAPGVETHLVLTPSMRDVDLQRSIESFSRLELKSLAFTRLDEASCYGGLLNALESARLPLSYFGFGREIPSDVERATPERVLDLLLDLSTEAQVGDAG